MVKAQETLKKATETLEYRKDHWRRHERKYGPRFPRVSSMAATLKELATDLTVEVRINYYTGGRKVGRLFVDGPVEYKRTWVTVTNAAGEKLLDAADAYSVACFLVETCGGLK